MALCLLLAGGYAAQGSPARISNGSSAQTRPATAAALIPQNPRLGLTFSNYFDGNPMYARAREAGASYDRVEFQMSALNPAPGVWNWSAYDSLVQAERSHNLQVLAVLTAPPAWAADFSYPYESWPVPANVALPWNHASNFWAQFVYQTVMHYKGSINTWQVWNEPDIRAYWKMPEAPASLFAQLLRASYQAIKAADPQATVVMGGFLYQHDQWPSPVTLWRAIRDLPDSALNNNYFDVMAFHLYDGGTCNRFDVIEDFRLHMTRPEHGGLRDHPVWITESGIRNWEGQAPSRQPGDRFATPDEAASYVIQNYAYALYKDVQRYFYFRTTDTYAGDGSVDINRWGLIRTDASLRPAYTAYQVAAQYLPATFTFSTHPDWDIVSRISYYGTPLGRVSVIWNMTRTAQTYALNAILPAATLVLQNGVTATLSAANGQYSFNLPPAPNFYWHNPPDYCLVGSPPLIVIEADKTPPVSVLNTLPATHTQTAITLTWSGGDDASGIWSYDLQYRINGGPWALRQSWIAGTRFVFNGLAGQQYAFRVRARDRAGNEQSWDTANVVTTAISSQGTHAAFLPLLARAAASCANPIANGGFEQDGGWAINPTVYPPTYTLGLAHMGQRSMQTGIPINEVDPGTLSFSSISQTVQVPAPGMPIHLTLWRNAQTQDAGGSTDDMFYVRLWDQYGTLHTLLESGAASAGWQALSFDLAPYAGQRITLLLGARNDGDGMKSVAYYDDVSIECAATQ